VNSQTRGPIPDTEVFRILGAMHAGDVAAGNRSALITDRTGPGCQR
jgi:hypothetical protein